MHIDIPEDLHNRLRHLAQDTGQDLDELLREAIEERLAIQEQAAAPADSSETLAGNAVMTHHYARLHKRDPKRNQYRYYLLDVQPNFFGTWSLIRESGKIGRPGQVWIDLCDSLDEAARGFEGKRLQMQRCRYADSVPIGDVNPLPR